MPNLEVLHERRIIDTISSLFHASSKKKKKHEEKEEKRDSPSPYFNSIELIDKNYFKLAKPKKI